MAGTSIKMDLDTDSVLLAFNRILEFGDDLSAPLKDIGEYLLIITDERFANEAGPGGVKWQDVKPATRKHKRNPKILTERSRLSGSFVYAVSPRELEFGTNIVYAAIHQFDGQHMPARPFLGIDEADRDEMAAILREHLERRMEGR